jgi:hypothetical protein
MAEGDRCMLVQRSAGTGAEPEVSRGAVPHPSGLDASDHIPCDVQGWIGPGDDASVRIEDQYQGPVLDHQAESRGQFGEKRGLQFLLPRIDFLRSFGAWSDVSLAWATLPSGDEANARWGLKYAMGVTQLWATCLVRRRRA